MVDPEKYIADGLKVIDQLIAQKNLTAAVKATQELLRINPYHRKVQKYLQRLQELIVRSNEENVDHDIEATMHLWNEGRFDDLMKIYTKLYQCAPTHMKLRALIEKLHTRLSQEQQNQRSEFVHKALGAIAGLMKEKKCADALQAANELLTVDPINKEAMSYVREAKKALIEERLAQNANLLESADFERALVFYESLLSIDPEHKRVKKLVLQTKAYIGEQKVLAAKIHLNESIARMKELFEKKEYEMVLQACEEIDRLESGNFTAKFFLKKAKATIAREADLQERENLKELWPALAEEFRKNPQGFVRV